MNTIVLPLSSHRRWRQVQSAFLSWASIPADACHRFDVGADDLQAMCDAYDERLRDAGGLDLVILGLGVNGHVGANGVLADRDAAP